MNSFYRRIVEQYKLNLPFAVYSKPNSQTIIALLQQDDVLYTITDFSESGFAFSSFHEKHNYLIPENHSQIVSTVFDKKKIVETETEYDVPTTLEKVNFEELVSKGIQAIQNKEFKKVVLSREENVTVANFDLVATFEKMIQLYPATFAYCFYHPKVGLWMGATPEQLVKVEDKVFATMALAGTQKDTGLDAIVWHDKEKEEQQFVTDFIVAELKEVTTSLNVSKPYSVKAGNIWHIKTDVGGALNSSNGLHKVIELLHPTPAVCGLPKAPSKAFILENEKYDRTFYTGFLGELNLSQTSNKILSDLFVNLRCMKIEVSATQTTAKLFMGCGITKDSIPEKEWEESVNKSVTMKKVLHCNS